MPDPIAPHAESAASGTTDQPDAQIDWEAAERSPEFQELVKRRRRFVIPATIFFLAWYLGFILLAGYAEDFMGSSIYEGFTVGYLLALTQFVMVWVLGWLYLRKADREFDPLETKARERAEAVLAERVGSGRFQREGALDSAAVDKTPPATTPTTPTTPSGGAA